MRAVMARRGLDVEESLESPSTVEDIGSLTIEDDTRDIPPKDFWKRPTPKEPQIFPSDGTSVLRFEIPFARIMPMNSENLKIKRYVVYDISVRQDCSEEDPNPATIERRYTDFRNLYLALKNMYPNKIAPVYFPGKVFIGNFKADLIAERSAAFEKFLKCIVNDEELVDSPHFLHFLQDIELTKACQLLDERRNESAIPLLENSFRLLNKIFMDRSKPVLLLLCRLVAACTSSPVPHHTADRWATLALSRYETLCDIDLLPLYIPLLHTCKHLWWQRGRDQKPIADRLEDMAKKGINIKSDLTLMQAIHKLDPRTETV